MRSLFLIAALAACSPYHLASTGVGPSASTHEQRVADVSDCTQQARSGSQDNTRAFLLGAAFSIPGIAIEATTEKQQARQIFTQCLTGRGWTDVRPATD